MGGRSRSVLVISAVMAVWMGALTAVGSSSAFAVVPGLVDLAVTIESQPAVVSPPGELALYEVTVSNVGTVPAASHVTIDLPAGASYRDDLSHGSCSAHDDDVRCTIETLAASQEQVLDVVSHTPAVAGVYTTKATVTATGVVEPLEYQDNNTDSTVTDVRSPNAQLAAGLVEEGDSLTLDVGDGRYYQLTVPTGVPGVIVERLAAQSGAGKVCGSTGCGDGFLLKFIEDHPTYQALDPFTPLEARLTFGSQDPCRGLGGACADMYWAPDETTPVLERMLNCPGAEGATPGDGTARPAPCINQRSKQAGIIYFDVRLLSTDPLSVPPLMSK